MLQTNIFANMVFCKVEYILTNGHCHFQDSREKPTTVTIAVDREVKPVPRVTMGSLVIRDSKDLRETLAHKVW